MPVLDPRERFAELARRPDAAIDLAEAALLIAAEEYPSLDVAAYLGRLDELAEAAAPWLVGSGSVGERVRALNRFLFVEHGFSGNRGEYEDPRNSFLNDVLDRRIGIPITLSLVYMEVGRRLGVAVDGIGFPGHFLTRIVQEPDLIVDPFFGRVIDEAECEERLRGMLGDGAELVPEIHLRPATSREILLRMLRNLKQIHIRASDFGRALGCCERILLLYPDAPVELRDRGLVYERLECFAAARNDLRRFLDLAPDDESAAAVESRLRGLDQQARLLH